MDVSTLINHFSHYSISWHIPPSSLSELPCSFLWGALLIWLPQICLTQPFCFLLCNHIITLSRLSLILTVSPTFNCDDLFAFLAISWLSWNLPMIHGLVRSNVAAWEFPCPFLCIGYICLTHGHLMAYKVPLVCNCCQVLLSGFQVLAEYPPCSVPCNQFFPSLTSVPPCEHLFILLSESPTP